MCTAARQRDLGTVADDHGDAGEPESHRDADRISVAAAQHGAAVAHTDSRTHDRSRDPDTAWARPVLRRR